MNNTSRKLLFWLFLGLVLFGGLVFSGWIVPHVIMPAALAIWLLFRIFIMSVDQKYFWWLLTVVGLFWAVFQLTHGEAPAVTEERPQQNEALSTLESWQSNLVFSSRVISERSTIKRELILMLTSFYAAKQPGTSQLEIRQALEQHQMPLPEPFYNFLFPLEPVKASRRSLRTRLQQVQSGLKDWYRQRSGQEAAEFNRMIDELTRFMEDALEK